MFIRVMYFGKKLFDTEEIDKDEIEKVLGLTKREFDSEKFEIKVIKRTVLEEAVEI